MKIQLLPEDINGSHDVFSCPFHQAIQRVCPNFKSKLFQVGTNSITITKPDQMSAIFIAEPLEMVTWIIEYDRRKANQPSSKNDLKWGLENLISVDLPLERYCENSATS